MIEAIRLAYAGIAAGSVAVPPGGLSITAIGGVTGRWVAIDDQYRPHLLLEYSGSDAAPARLESVDIGLRPLVIDGRIRDVIDVTCLVPALAEVFEQFVAAVLQRFEADPDESAAAVLTSVLQTWRRFLHPSATVRLGRDRLAAIFGELLWHST